jgi:hypothetical protein
MSHGENQAVEVRDGRLGRGVYAAQDALPGDVLMRAAGTRVPSRNMHSIQIDADVHVEVGSPMRYINHSCEPNCGLWVRRGSDVLEVHALRPLAAGEELTLDYATFEYEIEFMPGPCQCGAPTCRGRITGFKDLPEELVEAYGEYIAEYLQQMALVERTV